MGVSQHSLLFLDAVLATCRNLQLKICDWESLHTTHEKKAEDSKGGGHRLGEEYWHEQMKTNRKSAASKKELKGKESIWLGKCLLERTKILSKNGEAALPTQISINDQGTVKVLHEKDLASDKLLKL
ncbi:hypothetical protein BHE74_00050239 [Ensete ventricosum]|uniref:Uncharacterized protein n=1 Tax=Ensete ventricosum TaxID=4639 RepID=A0A444FXB6_ENSVE|nr:hypothetical protein GW17_00008307 [Ensete ventricosum]RWW44037.1 hypothetical protein BHE74_00050239 [Ensete ventricosum]RZR70975.1 hypothetical protein BHM03_00002576 [Ensete ventricosum]